MSKSVKGEGDPKLNEIESPYFLNDPLAEL